MLDPKTPDDVIIQAEARNRLQTQPSAFLLTSIDKELPGIGSLRLATP
jgi:hypothetical protein